MFFKHVKIFPYRVVVKLNQWSSLIKLQLTEYNNSELTIILSYTRALSKEKPKKKIFTNYLSLGQPVFMCLKSVPTK